MLCRHKVLDQNIMILIFLLEILIFLNKLWEDFKLSSVWKNVCKISENQKKCILLVDEVYVKAVLHKENLFDFSGNSEELTKTILGIILGMCREEKNLVFWFGAQFNSTLNFTQSGWLILFSPDLHFRLAKRVSGQNHSLRLETATRTDVPLVVPA